MEPRSCFRDSPPTTREYAFVDKKIVAMQGR